MKFEISHLCSKEPASPSVDFLKAAARMYNFVAAGIYIQAGLAARLQLAARLFV